MTRILAREFIDEQISIAHQDMIPATLRGAYAQVKALADRTDFLRTPTSAFARGHLIAWAAEFEIFRLIRDGHWPYDCEWEHYVKPTGLYLRIDTGGAFVTVNQIAEMREVPRFAKHRQNAGLGNYPLLPFDEFAREAEENNRKHLVIGHGYQDLRFAIIGAPKPKSKLWIDKTDNLLLRSPPLAAMQRPEDIPGGPDTEGAPEEGTDITIDLELTEHLQRQVRDSDG